MTAAGTHRLTAADMRELADPEGGAGLARRLRAAELSKHKLLLEQVRKRLGRDRPGETFTAFESLRNRLVAVEKTHPDLVARVLATPHLGAWTAQSLMALDAGRDPDIEYFAALVAAACERAGQRFEISLPIHSGPLNLPGVGMVRASDGRVRVTEPVRVRAEAGGLVLEASLDPGDPQLAGCGLRGMPLGPADLAAWREAVPEAWAVLVRYSRPTAAAVAEAAFTALLAVVFAGGAIPLVVRAVRGDAAERRGILREQPRAGHGREGGGGQRELQAIASGRHRFVLLCG